jgi:hypothetical protein
MLWMLLPPNANTDRLLQSFKAPMGASWLAMLRAAWLRTFK